MQLAAPLLRHVWVKTEARHYCEKRKGKLEKKQYYNKKPELLQKSM